MMYFWREGPPLFTPANENLKCECRKYISGCFAIFLFSCSQRHSPNSVFSILHFQWMRGEQTPLRSGFRENYNVTCQVPDWEFDPSLFSPLFLGLLFNGEGAPFGSSLPLSGFLCSVQWAQHYLALLSLSVCPSLHSASSKVNILA